MAQSPMDITVANEWKTVRTDHMSAATGAISRTTLDAYVPTGYVLRGIVGVCGSITLPNMNFDIENGNYCITFTAQPGQTCIATLLCQKNHST